MVLEKNSIIELVFLLVTGNLPNRKTKYKQREKIFGKYFSVVRQEEGGWPFEKDHLNSGLIDPCAVNDPRATNGNPVFGVFGAATLDHWLRRGQ
jgi:hypothetical protein